MSDTAEAVTGLFALATAAFVILALARIIEGGNVASMAGSFSSFLPGFLFTLFVLFLLIRISSEV
jgi:hypothetical protein